MILHIKVLATGFYAGNMAVGDTYVKRTPILGLDDVWQDFLGDLPSLD